MNVIPVLKLSVLILLMGLLAGCGGDKESPKLQKGDIAPDFSAMDLKGNTVSMSSLAGSPIILRFWSVDCKYCRADTPVFNNYYTRFKAQGLKVFYINIRSDLKEVEDFVADLHIQFPVLLDTEGKIALSYQVKLVPQTIIISPEHKIVAAQLGGVGDEELRLLLAPYLELKVQSAK